MPQPATQLKHFCSQPPTLLQPEIILKNEKCNSLYVCK